MNHVKTATLVLLLCVSVALAAAFYSARRQNHQLNSALIESLRVVTNAQALAESKGQTIGLLEDQVEKLTEILTNSTARLKTAEEAISGYEVAAAQARKAQNETQRLLSEVPAPTVTVEHSPAGKETKSFTFPKLLSASGAQLAANATFVSPTDLHGRRLVFHRPDGALTLAFDVDDLHPAVLRYLSIDVADAKARQDRIDAGWKAKAAADYQAYVADQAQKRQWFETQQRVQIEQDKANAEIARNQAQQQAIEEQAYNERLKAQAAAKQADAAMLQALNPQPAVIIQNVNR